MLTFSEFIYNERVKRKYSTRFVADMIGVSHSAISAWENDKNKITVDSAIKLLKFYNTTYNLNGDK